MLQVVSVCIIIQSCSEGVSKKDDITRNITAWHLWLYIIHMQYGSPRMFQHSALNLHRDYPHAHRRIYCCQPSYRLTGVYHTSLLTWSLYPIVWEGTIVTIW